MSTLAKGWGRARLDEICEINPTKDPEVAEVGECSFVPMTAVETETGRLDPSRVEPVSELSRRSFRSFREGDVLVAKITPSMENGKAAVARGLKNGVGFGSTEFHVLRPMDEVNPDYVLHFILQRRFRADARRNMTGTAGQLRVPADFLREAAIPVAPVAEQRRIVAAIEELFSRLDAAESNLIRVVRQLTILEASALGAIDASGAPSRPLAEISSLIADGDHNPPARVPSGIPHLTAKHVKNGRLVAEGCTFVSEEGFEQTRRRYDPAPGDIIVTCVGTIGETAIVQDGLRFSADRNLAAIRLRPPVDSEYVRLALRAPAARRRMASASGSTAQPHLYLRDIRALVIPVPSLDEQRRIVAELELQLSLIDSLRAAVRVAQKRSALLRGAILERAFRGKLVTQDTGDEPVAVLLDRIRAERAAAPKPKLRKRAPA